MDFVPELVHPLDSRVSIESYLTELDLILILDTLTSIELGWDGISISEYRLVASDSQRE